MKKGPVVCLLPVRDGEADLPGYLESAARFADAVVALDDGSTDATRELLAAAPLVRVLLANPPREGYGEWDDAANRNRLLEAAAPLEPSWIFSLDVDERLDPGDGDALRRFLETEAIPGFAFGFRALRMWGDLEHYEATGYWIYRLFAFEPGQRFPERRLHFDPIPTSIPPSRHLRTTLRIQHLAGLTPERRAARVAKYRQADPERAFSYEYPDATEEAADVRRWEPRSPDLPVLAPGPAAHAEAAPALSAVIISRDDEARIARTVRSVVEQECEWPFEVIVVTSGTDATAEIVRQQFPEVTLIELPQPALPGEARNAGLRAARGDYVSFPGSHVELPPGSLEARIGAHDLGHAMVTGTTLNGTDTRAGWAAYFLDHASVLPGRPSTELPGPPAHCSYLRSALLEVGGFPEHLRAGEDTVVNQALARRGYTAYRACDARLVHHSPCRTRRRLVRHYFVRGRSFGRILLERHRSEGRLLRRSGPRALFRLQVRDRVSVISRQIAGWGDDREQGEYRRARRLVRMGAIAHWLGTLWELLRPRRAGWFLLWGRPVVTLAVFEPKGGFVRLDVVSRRVKIVRLRSNEVPDLPVDGHLALRPDDDWGRRLLTVRGVLRPRLGIRCRLTLVWAALTVRPDDVHDVELDGGSKALLGRHLDTRSRHEGTASVTPPPPRPRPLFPPRSTARR